MRRKGESFRRRNPSDARLRTVQQIEERDRNHRERDHSPEEEGCVVVRHPGPAERGQLQIDEHEVEKRKHDREAFLRVAIS